MTGWLRRASVVKIISDHLRTFDADGESKSVGLLIFFGGPALLAAVGWYLGWRMSGLGSLLAALAILVGLFFNVLVLLFDVAIRFTTPEGQENPELTRDRVALVRQTEANTAFAVLVGVVLVVLVGLGAVLSAEEPLPEWLTAVVVFLLAVFFLTLLIVLKRIRANFEALLSK